jgi:hypothetical protein
MLHATDLLDLRDHGVDERLARHPGMTLPLARKRELLEERLSAIVADYHVAPYADLFSPVPPGEGEGISSGSN